MTKFRYVVLFLVLIVISIVALAISSPAEVNGVEILYTYKVVQTYPHDPTAFTQGLVFHDGFLYEGIGLYGKSSLRKVSMEDGEVVEYVNLARDYFGEGITILGEKVFQLTWRENRGLVYDLATLQQVDEFSYPTEGWGLTTDGKHLIMSDGSDVITYLDPKTFEPLWSIGVQSENGPVNRLNELEYINGEIYANIWFSDLIARIDPVTGKVLGWIDLGDLHRLEKAENSKVDVMNGIAYDQENERLFITGKLWSHIYEILVCPYQ
jgi:glutamine cyclotransferase